jgi:universal stress protein A
VYKTILHPTDLSESHFAMCKKAVEITNCFGGKLHLLHVIEPPATMQLAQGLGFATEAYAPVKENAQSVMRILGEALNIPAEQQHVEIGSIKIHILDKIQTLGCELVIIGTHIPSPLSTFLGSTMHAVAHKAPCDVLALRIKI